LKNEGKKGNRQGHKRQKALIRDYKATIGNPLTQKFFSFRLKENENQKKISALKPLLDRIDEKNLHKVTNKTGILGIKGD
jgi:hypothetical protein